jgi:hypothetical protein
MQGIIIVRFSKYSSRLCWLLKNKNAQTDKRLCSGFILIFASLLVVLKALVVKANDIFYLLLPKAGICTLILEHLGKNQMKCFIYFF